MLKEDARAGGQIAGSERKQIERKLGRSIVSEKNFLKSNNRKKIKNMSYDEMIVAIANLTHESFFDIYQKANNGSKVKTTIDKTWIEKHGTNQADLAKLKYSELPSDWQKERWYGAKIALDTLLKTVKLGKPLNDEFIEYTSNIIHEKWLPRNMERAKDYHKLPYAKLSEFQKEKDRIFVRAAIDIYKKN